MWLMRRWGEYFAVIATCVFLPLEVYELTEKVTAFRLGALLINVAAVVWLLWSKRLFGLNGGGEAYRAEHSAESLLTVERAAHESDQSAQPDVPADPCRRVARRSIRSLITIVRAESDNSEVFVDHSCLFVERHWTRAGRNEIPCATAQLAAVNW